MTSNRNSLTVGVGLNDLAEVELLADLVDPRAFLLGAVMTELLHAAACHRISIETRPVSHHTSLGLEPLDQGLFLGECYRSRYVQFCVTTARIYFGRRPVQQVRDLVVDALRFFFLRGLSSEKVLSEIDERQCDNETVIARLTSMFSSLHDSSLKWKMYHIYWRK